MADASVSPRPLSELLVARRKRGFVGRDAELELMRDALARAVPPFSVLYMYGPGGIGKSSLVDVIADLAAETGATIARVDGREVSPEPTAVLGVLAESLDVPDGGAAITTPGRPVIVLDTYERLAPLDDWVRTKLLPRLPATAVVVIAGRAPPDASWRADPGFGDLLRVVSVRNLTPAEGREYLLAKKVEPARHEEILQVTHGHPLALALLTDHVARGGEPVVDPMPPDLVATLMQRVVEAVPSELHRRALEVCALARVTTEALLRDALEVDDAHDLFEWLHGLSFIHAGAEGLYPHDLARDLLDANLRWRDPATYKQVFRGVWTHIRRLLQSTTGRAQQQAIFDLKFVFRNLPDVLSPVDWASWGGFYPEPAAPRDREAIINLVQAAEGVASAAIAEHWLDRQPEGFRVLRHHSGSIRGVVALIDLTRASAEDLAADPGADAAWRFARRSGPSRPGEVVTQTRFVIDQEAYQEPSPTLNAVPVLTLQQYLCTAELSWDFLTLAEPDRWNDYFAVADLPRAEGADFEVGGRRYGLFAHDFRRVPVDAWLELVTERALARDATPEPTAAGRPQPLVLSQPEFKQAVKQALHDLHRHDLLARSTLLRARLVLDDDHDEERGADALAGLLHDAVDTLRGDPRDDKLLCAVDRTYLRPAATQESAAAMLGLPFSTYRRHLTQGVERVVAWLWEREVYGDSEPSNLETPPRSEHN
ncbi:MAG: ATP-binding protein [Nocardioides sp.]|uniref:ATP-binding protein n=1 Tax=Nocardioides sp. TaxID=35761 RepID=UPI003D6A7EDB